MCAPNTHEGELVKTASATGALEAEVRGFLQSKIAEILGVGVETLGEDALFRDLGIDSHRAARLVGELSRYLGREVSITLPWTCPTIRQMAKHLATGRATEGRSLLARRHDEDPIAIIGMGCRLPGNIASPAELWRGLCKGLDGIRDVPPDRWDANAYYDPDTRVPGKISARRGGFLERVDAFDASFFGI